MKNISVLVIAMVLISTGQGMEQIKTIPEECNMIDNAKHSPLYYACKNNNTEIAQLLLEQKADPNNPKDTITPLNHAIENHNKDLVKMLLNHNANPNSTKNAAKEPPLITAVKAISSTDTDTKKCVNAKEILYLLLSNHTIDRTAVNQYGQTALNYATAKDNADAVFILLSNKNVTEPSDKNN